MIAPAEMSTMDLLAEYRASQPPTYPYAPGEYEAWSERHAALWGEMHDRPTVAVIHARCAAVVGDGPRGSVSLGCIGPRERFATVGRNGGGFLVSIYGETIGYAYPETVTLDTCGHFTMSTRAALGWLLGDPSPSLATPGSRGGKPGPASLAIHAHGQRFVLREGNGPLTITNEETNR